MAVGQTVKPVTSAGMAMEDGRGQLADGTRYEKRTTEEFGADGYWLRTTVMRGVSAGGKVCADHPAAAACWSVMSSPCHSDLGIPHNLTHDRAKKHLMHLSASSTSVF